MTKILVYYYIQNDPWESLKEPNVYALEKKYNHPGEVSVKDTYDCFPIRNQKYYLRYFIDDSKQNLKGWLDLPPSAKAPVYNDKVYVKALRLNPEVNLTFKNDLFKKTSDHTKQKSQNLPNSNLSNQGNFISTDNFRQPTSKSPQKVISSNTSAQPSVQSSTVNSSKSSTSNNMSTTKFNSQGGVKELINMHNKENNLLNFDNQIKFQDKKVEDPYNINNLDLNSIIFHDDKTAETHSPQQHHQEDGFNIFINSGENKQSPKKEPQPKSEFDLGSLGLDFGATQNNIPSGGQNQPKVDAIPTVNFPKEELFFALPPLTVDPGSLDQFAISEMCDPIINHWAGLGGFEKKNIRMLLSTLHEIWLSDKWKKVSLGDILDDGPLKRVYAKSIMHIHPDKIHSSDPRMKYMAQRVFNIINESYNEAKK